MLTSSKKFYQDFDQWAVISLVPATMRAEPHWEGSYQYFDHWQQSPLGQWAVLSLLPKHERHTGLHSKLGKSFNESLFWNSIVALQRAVWVCVQRSSWLLHGVWWLAWWCPGCCHAAQWLAEDFSLRPNISYLGLNIISLILSSSKGYFRAK